MVKKETCLHCDDSVKEIKISRQLKIDQLAWQAVFGPGQEKARKTIRSLANQQGIFLASINDFYLARGRGELSLDFTVPAINLRGLVYDSARAVFQAAAAKKVNALILEIARSEISYTHQSPDEHAAVVVAAAIREGFRGPLFLQGDHFQAKPASSAGIPKASEIQAIKKLIKEAIAAGFYNLDLDLSTLVDYTKKSLDEQQQTNYTLSAKLAEYCRSLEPKGITIALGAEIGHIGGKNSTEAELHAFMKGFQKNFKPSLVGLSKISIQTGTHHGGVVLPDGSLTKVAVDFSTLKRLAKAGRRYGLAGTVQHGASTLPAEFFRHFPQSQAVEIHLATEFQNLIMDHPLFPKDLLAKMYGWIDEKAAGERQPEQTDAQFHYQLRKKAWGPFKKECWSLPEKIKAAIRADLVQRFAFLFQQLNVENSQNLVAKFIHRP